MKKEILKLFKKYGFDSLREPFIYEDKDNVGIYYSFLDDEYGELSRVFVPHDIDSLKSFMSNYYAYKNSHCMKIRLKSYNDPYAEPIFEEDIELLDEDMYVNDVLLYQSANLIIKIIEKKLELFFIIYDNVKRLTDKYLRIQEEICKKKNISFDDKDYYRPNKIKMLKSKKDSIIIELNQSLNNCVTKDDYKRFIDYLIDYLRNLELEDSFINNKYFMIKIPIIINDLKEELKVLDEYNIVKSKRKKKVELENKLKELEKNKFKNNIISLANFVKIEKSKIKEKYEIVSDLDYESIGNYLVEFDNLEFKDNKKYNGKDVLKDWFEELSNDEKNVLYLNVFFRKIIGDEYLVKDYFRCILNPINILAKIKIFKDLDLSSFKDFKVSVDDVINKLFDINMIEISDDLVGYFEDSKVISDKVVICSLKKSCMPKKECSNPVKYIVTLRKGCKVYYVPSKLVIDHVNDDKIVLKEGNSLLLVDLKKNIIYDENDDIIKVARIRILEKKTTDVVTVSKIKTEKVDCYKRIVMERKDI